MTDHTRDSRLKTLTPQAVKETTIVDVDELDTTDIRGTGDGSPHLGRRAQPGDILGIETAGETTGIGDTSEDEDKRRRDLVKAAQAFEDEKTERNRANE
jgi:hypothetical protein